MTIDYMISTPNRDQYDPRYDLWSVVGKAQGKRDMERARRVYADTSSDYRITRVHDRAVIAERVTVLCPRSQYER